MKSRRPGKRPPLVAGRVRVRRARLADHPVLTSLFRRFYREEGFARAAIARVPETLAHVLRRRDTVCLVAETGGGIVGAAALSTAYGLEVGAYAEIEDIYVLPAWRERGVASALVEACLAWARSRGCHDVEVVLTPHARERAGLAAWYAKRGFRDSGRHIWQRTLARRRSRRRAIRLARPRSQVEKHE
jgi:aminoglycoside 6'-N-acetyltransferase I